ncbi:MAG: hypothetical protein JO149_09770 [Gammaproteobacteria bacterium]|nr:hypothetical protein [Gammaproteobacteria bacterium]
MRDASNKEYFFKTLENVFNIKAQLMAFGVDIPYPIKTDIDFKPYIKALYDHDLDGASFQYPQEIVLLKNGGRDQNINIYAHVRRNSESPLKLISEENKVFLMNNSDEMIEVGVPSRPNFYGHVINDEEGETVVDKYVQKMGHDVLSIVLSNNCEYYSRKVQCAFCEIVETFQENRILKRPKKDLRALAKSMAYALSTEKEIKRILLNGGNLTKDNDETFLELIRLLQYAKELVDPSIWSKLDILLVLMPPSNFDLIDKIKEAGATTVYFNLELWLEEHFSHFTPGKAQFGRKRMFDALAYAVNVFGIGNVYTNLIFGIQSISINPPYIMFGNKEKNILLDAVKKLADINVVLTNTIYHSRGRNKLGSIELDVKALAEYHREYGRIMTELPIVHANRIKEYAIFGGIGSFPNCLCNEGYLLALFEKGN